MNNKLRTFRGDARSLHLCFERQKLNRILMSFMVLFLMSSVGANAQALGNALDFDGTDDYVSFSNTIPDFILSTGTVETWIKTTDAGTGFRGIVTKEHAYGILLQDNEIGILSWGAPFVGAGIYANDGNWHHIVVTFQENVVNGTKLYYDGNLVLTATVGTYWWGHVNSNLKIGRNTAAQSFAGQIDEVRVWNDIRTLSEIQNNKDAELTSSEAGLVGYYKFNQGVANGDNTSPAVNTLDDNKIGGTPYNGIVSGFTLNGATSNWVSGATATAPTFDVGFNAAAICAEATEWLVPINVGTVTGDIGAISLVLDYDNTKLTYSAVESVHANLTGAALDNSGDLQVSDNNGKITISWINATAATINNETVLTLKFVPASGAADFSAIAGQTTNFSWDETVAGNCEFADDMGGVVATTFNPQTGATVNSTLTAGLTSDKAGDEICLGDEITFTGTGAGAGTSLGNAFNFTNDPSNPRYNMAGNNSSLPTGSAARTIQTWVKIPAIGGGGVVLLWGNTLPGQGSGIFVDYNTGQAVHLGNGGGNVYGTSDLRDDQWHQITITFDGSTSKIYVDGTEENSQTSGIITNASGNFVIGSNLVYNTFLTGDVDELRVWDVVKTPTEILSTMNTELVGNEANLVAYYNFNQGVAGGSNTISTVTDLTGNADATIQDAFTGSTISATSGTENNFVGGATPNGTYEFFVDNGSGYAAVTNTTAATYASSTLADGDKVKVIVTSTSGCVAESAEITVTVNPLPTAGLTSDATTNTTLCDGDNITFTATGGTLYEFSLTSDGVTTVVQVESATATYSNSTLADGDVVTVAVKDANGCSSTTTLTMVVNPLPTVTMTSDDADNEICAGETVTFTGAGGTSYSFDVNGGTAVAGTGAGSNEFSSSTLADGDVVTVTGTDANGCSNTATITMTVNPLPTAGLTSDKTNDEVCLGDAITFTGSGIGAGGGTGSSVNFTSSPSTRILANNTSLPQGANSFTMEIWMKSDGVNTVQESFFGWGTGGFAHGQMARFIVNFSGELEYNANNAAYQVIATGSNVRDGNWHHCVATYDGTTLILYIDGVQVGSKAMTLNLSGANLAIGASPGASLVFDGNVDEARVYNTVLTPTQIQANMNSETPLATGLVAHFPLNEGTPDGNNSGVVATDATGNSTSIQMVSLLMTGTSSNFVSSAPYGGYQFFVDNGSGYSAVTNTTANTYASSSLSNGDKVKVKVTNANGCSAESSEITVTVNGVPTTALASDDADSRVCQGQSVTFTASSTDGADEFIFVSSIDGTVQAQSATTTYTDNGLQDGEIISVTGVNTTTGCQAASATTFTMDVDGCHAVSGNLVYKNSAETPMGNVNITVTGPGVNTVVNTDHTDGSFTVDNLFDNETYNFAYATTKTHGGINSTDALLALLDAVNIFNQSGLNAKAADVNLSNTITGADALGIQLRFVFAGITSYPGGQDWVFDAGSFTPNGSDITGQTLNGLAMGDINGSYTPNIAENGTVSMVNDAQMVVNNGDRVQIPVRIKQTEDVGAMSLAMFFPSNAMTIHDVTLADGTVMLNNVDGNELRMAWADINSQIFGTDDVLYYIDATIHDVAAYNVSPFAFNVESELADGTGAVLQQVTLGVPSINGIVTNTNAIEAAAASVRNFPNPFSDYMTIEYDLPSTSQVSIQMFNSLGQEVATLVNETQSEGTHRAIWNANEKTAGVYFYTITVTEGNDSYTKTKQVVLVK